MRKAFEIGGAAIQPGSRRTVDIPVSVLSDHTPVTMSAHVIHGRRSGPIVFITAGIHGDEVIGAEIVRRLLAIRTLDSLKGTLITIPIVNAFGFLNQSRYLPDRRDLNRCFPGSARGSLAARLAHLLMHEVVERCDLGIDLHSAAIHRTNLPQVRVAAGDRESIRLAKVFGAPVVLQSSERDGSLRAAAQASGVRVLLYEAGEGLRFDELAVRAGVAGILRVLHDLGMITSRGVPKARGRSMLLKTSRWVRAPGGGLLRVYRDTGDVVSAGEVLAVVSDPFGEREREVIASADGIVVGRAVMPIVNEGDALFHIAQTPSNEVAENTVQTIRSDLEGDPIFDEDEII
ncbi:succinylglutamate desuccinylase/aspartoacylase family protein [Aliiruegeria lutimaris]|uniref:Succinylglutamate desuccinylase/Aspartoacylase catalytic domain-containing protein n=1 Tax=Aliiruegeria lutimaris TaxID=571298 RepID=A0A1G9LBL8_9RHOB|nr:succinylglutamate desuccinylase/aspartoacylase family protein [Aliiruegeria lutimaris]SDL59153.1 hypothetical protein SAMN04488026_10968 [Aliiruegeria lutimaris]